MFIIRFRTSSRRLASSRSSLEAVLAVKFPEVDHYGQDLLTLIGIVTLRAGHLEEYLVHFMCAVSKIPPPQAHAIFYSSQNSKARLDMIRALIGASDFSKARREHAIMLLDLAKDLSDRRNDLIHSQYMISMKGGNPPPPPERVRVQNKPATKQPYRSEAVNEEAIVQLAEDYENLRQRLWDFYSDVSIPKRTGKPSRGTPD